MPTHELEATFVYERSEDYTFKGRVVREDPEHIWARMWVGSSQLDDRRTCEEHGVALWICEVSNRANREPIFKFRKSDGRQLVLRRNGDEALGGWRLKFIPNVTLAAA